MQFNVYTRSRDTSTGIYTRNLWLEFEINLQCMQYTGISEKNQSYSQNIRNMQLPEGKKQ